MTWQTPHTRPHEQGPHGPSGQSEAQAPRGKPRKAPERHLGEQLRRSDRRGCPESHPHPPRHRSDGRRPEQSARPPRPDECIFSSLLNSSG